VLARYVFDGLGLDMTRTSRRSIWRARATAENGARRPRRGAMGRRRRLAGVRSDIEWARGRALYHPRRGGHEAHSGEVSLHQTDHAACRQLQGTGRAVAALGSWSLVLARPAARRGSVQARARSAKGEAALGAKLEQAKESTLANTLAAAPRQDLIHPGVLKYMRDAGILK